MNQPDNAGERPDNSTRGSAKDHGDDDGSDFDLSAFSQPSASPAPKHAPAKRAASEHAAPARTGRSIAGKVPPGKALIGNTETGKFAPGKDDPKPRPHRDAFTKRDDAARSRGARSEGGRDGAGPRRDYGDKPARAGKPFDRAGGYGGAQRPAGDRKPYDRSGSDRESGPRDRARSAGASREGAGRDFNSRPPREGGDRQGGFRKDGPPRDFAKRSDFTTRGSSHPGPQPGDGPRTAPRYLRNVERVGGDHKPASAEIKPFLPLKTDKGRWKESQFLLEGAKNIADVIAISPAILQTVFITADFKEKDKEMASLLKKNRVSVILVTEDDIKALSDTEAPQGILAVANFATLRPDWNTSRYVTLLDAVQDPGNVGAVLRTSLALGMDAVVLGKGSCDPYNPKVVRSSVGALMGLPFETGEDIGSKIAFLRTKGFSIVATSSHAQVTLEQAKLRKKVALIMGNEGAGTGATYLDMADAVVRIPLKNKVESLNVAVAHGILSYQLIHGRE